MMHRSVYGFGFLFLHRKCCMNISVRCVNIKLLQRFFEALEEKPINMFGKYGRTAATCILSSNVYKNM